MKHCKACDSTKSLDDFHRDKTAHDGLAFYCKACQIAKTRAHYAANRDAIRAKNRARQAHRTPQMREAILIRKYSINSFNYERIFDSQGHCCAICFGTEAGRKDSRYLPVDHDHETGQVRGILCHSCNRAVGLLGDSAKQLHMAAAYIERN